MICPFVYIGDADVDGLFVIHAGTEMKRFTKSWPGLIAKAVFAITVLGAVIPVSMAADEPVLTVATNPNYVPFEFRDPETGQYTGFDMDVIHAVAKRAGFKIDLKTMDFAGIIPALQAHTIDIAIPSITITAQRAKVVDFSDPYYDSGLKLLVRAGNNTIHSIADLKGKVVATKLGTTSYDYLKKHAPDIKKIIPYPGTAQMYMSLVHGTAVAALYDAPNVLYFAKTKGKGKVKPVGPLYAGQQYGIAFPKGSKWVKPVNKALDEIKSDGTLNRLYEKWFDKPAPKDLVGNAGKTAQGNGKS